MLLLHTEKRFLMKPIFNECFFTFHLISMDIDYACTDDLVRFKMGRTLTMQPNRYITPAFH